MTEKKKQSRLKIISVIACLVIATYSGYWFFLAVSGQNVITTWQNNLVKTGGSLGYSSLSASGYPFKVKITVTDFKLVQKDKTEWNFPRLETSVNPLNIYNFSFSAPEKNIFTAGERSPAHFTASFTNLNIQSSNNLSENTSAYTFSTEDIIFSPPEGMNTKVKELSFDYFGFNVSASPVITSFDISSFNLWKKNNGEIVLNDFTVRQPGISVVISGKTTFDTMFNPRFNGDVSVTGIDNVLSGLYERGIIGQEAVTLVSGFAASLNGGKEIEKNQPVIAPIKTGDDGIISVGPFPAVRIPGFRKADISDKSKSENKAK